MREAARQDTAEAAHQAQATAGAVHHMVEAATAGAARDIQEVVHLRAEVHQEVTDDN